jgi:hypothetical protein
VLPADDVTDVLTDITDGAVTRRIMRGFILQQEEH